MRRWWVESEEAIGGGSERDNVVTECGATELSELVLVVEKMGRNTPHFCFGYSLLQVSGSQGQKLEVQQMTF